MERAANRLLAVGGHVARLSPWLAVAGVTCLAVALVNGVASVSAGIARPPLVSRAHGVQAASAAGCAEVYFIGARGSGESGFGGLGPEVDKLMSVARSVLAAHQISMRAVADPYPADNAISDLMPTVGEIALFITNPPAGAVYYYHHNVAKFLASLDVGIADAVTLAEGEHRLCPGSLLILAGYSQGAMAVRQAELQLAADHESGVLRQIGATLLLGDGDRVKNTAAKEFGTSRSTAKGLRTWLGQNSGQDVVQPLTTANICDAGDIVCDFALARVTSLKAAAAAIKVHTSYARPGKNGHYTYDPALTAAATRAADLIAAEIARRAQDPGQLNTLESVHALSPTNVWAAGMYCTSCTQFNVSDKTLILHWDGRAWSHVPSPSPSTSNNDLYGISADSADDAWAVGDYCLSSCELANPGLLILHWDGTAWSQMPAPSSAGGGVLHSVDALSPSDAWAVGDDFATDTTLILHWDGKKWSRLPSPTPGSPILAELWGVSADSAHDAWAVGNYCASACTSNKAIYPPLILRWNGTKWSQVAGPSPHAYNDLQAVAATSPKNAWAVGWSGPNQDSLILHWNGAAWSQQPTPNIDNLWGVSASSAGVWAVGDVPVFLHWTQSASRWTEVGTPNIFGVGYSSVSTDTAGDAWAVGGYCASRCSAKTPVFYDLILHWNGTRWSVS